MTAAQPAGPGSDPAEQRGATAGSIDAETTGTPAALQHSGLSGTGHGRRPIKVVAFGGGHGLAASLRGLRHCAPHLDLDITAVVTVGDNGGSSGRLRAERDAQLPPGDLRMALAALAGDDPGHQRTVALMQHRFALVGKQDRRISDSTGEPAVPAGQAVLGPPGSSSRGSRSGSAARAGNAETLGLSGAEPRDGIVVEAGRRPGVEARNDPSGGAGNSAELEAGVEAGNKAGLEPADQAGDRAGVGVGVGAGDGAGDKAGWGNVDRRIASVGGKHDPLAGHAVGNLLLLGLMELLGDPVEALEHAAAMVGACGRVLPMASHAVGIEADVRGGDPARPDDVVTVRGQHAVAITTGHVEALRIVPSSPPACQPALVAIAEADWLIFGPGSWYTSVLPHLLVPELAEAIVASPARRLVTLNLAADNETLGLSVADHLAALHWYLPRLRVDTVLADAKWVGEPDPVHRAAQALGARLVLAPLAVADGSPKHDPESLGTALVPVLGSDR